MDSQRDKIEEEMRREAREMVFGLLRRQSFVERMEPVAAELTWLLYGSEDAAKHEYLLPA
jgi:hypothetical protein